MSAPSIIVMLHALANHGHDDLTVARDGAATLEDCLDRMQEASDYLGGLWMGMKRRGEENWETPCAIQTRLRDVLCDIRGEDFGDV